MRQLNVLYDQECGLCQRCCHWLSQQPAFIELRFIPLQSAVFDHALIMRDIPHEWHQMPAMFTEALQ